MDGVCVAVAESDGYLKNADQSVNDIKDFNDSQCDAQGNPQNTQVDSLIANIFGDHSDTEDAEKSTSPCLSENIVEEGPKFEFERTQELRKKERAKRRRRKTDAVNMTTLAEIEVERIVEQMRQAAADDREANVQRRPALQKMKLLATVKKLLLRIDYYEIIIENDMMSMVSEWLTPLPDRSLPSLDIRTTLLKILSTLFTLESTVLKQSGLGKAVMTLFKHPKESRQNKAIAADLIRRWAQPIFQSADYDEVLETYYNPDAKRRRIQPRQRQQSPTIASPVPSVISRQASCVNFIPSPRPQTPLSPTRSTASQNFEEVELSTSTSPTRLSVKSEMFAETDFSVKQENPSW